MASVTRGISDPTMQVIGPNCCNWNNWTPASGGPRTYGGVHEQGATIMDFNRLCPRL